MGAPRVVDDRLVFTVDDPEHDLAMVHVTLDDDLVGEHRFRRTTDGWTLSVPVPPVRRVEYRLLVTDSSGTTHVVVDPDNPIAVTTAFGDRSVALLPGYTTPGWLDEPTIESTRDHVAVATRVGEVPLSVWRPNTLPDDVDAPLLVVHDGPEYDRLAQLGRWAAATIRTARLAPFRIALLRPVRRDEWYAVNDDWPSSVAAIVTRLDRTFARRGAIVVMGASLGGLAALQVATSPAMTDAVDVVGVFSQSGSFFRPDLDPQEADYPFFGRIATWVADLAESGGRGPASAGSKDRPLDVAMTCGLHEENHANNVSMARVLEAAGHRVALRSLSDLHNYTAWRDGLEPDLSALCRRAWVPPRADAP